MSLSRFVFPALFLFPIAATTMTALPAQNRTLVDANYYMKEVDRNAPKLLEQAKNAGKLRPHERQGLLNQIQWAGQRLDNVYKRLAQLPANDPQVQALKKHADARAAEFKAAIEMVNAVDGKANAAAAKAQETINADRKQLMDLSGEINMGSMLQSHPARALETVRSLDKMVEFRNACATKYAAVLDQPVGDEMNNCIRGFDSRLERYRQDMTRHAAQLPTSIRSDLDTANSIAELGIQRKSARPFTAGGIQQAFGRAQIGIEMLEAITGPSNDSRQLRKELAAVEKRIAMAQKQLEGEILKSNQAPKDLYQGADKDTLMAMVAEKWKKGHPKAEVLGMRIPMRAWERHSSWRFALDRFKKEDISQLQVAILVKADADTAHVYYAHLEKDHLAGDTVKVLIDDKGEVALYRKVLIANID